VGHTGSRCALRIQIRRWLRSRALGVGAALLSGLLSCGLVGPTSAETLAQALSAAYQFNPRLDAARATQRATDEEVPRALSGYRPSITGSADTSYQHVTTNPATFANGDSNPRGYQIGMVQPLFRGFRTVNAVNAAEATVRAGRETLRLAEQSVLLEAVTAFSDVVRDAAIVRLRENNVAVLTRDLSATQDRSSTLIPDAVDGVTVHRAQRNCELIADLHAEGSPLSKAHMMGMRRPATADHARLLRHELEMLLVSDPPFLWKRQLAVSVLRVCLISSSGSFGIAPAPQDLGTGAHRQPYSVHEHPHSWSNSPEEDESTFVALGKRVEGVHAI
jgi:hypothetical protein